MPCIQIGHTPKTKKAPTVGAFFTLLAAILLSKTLKLRYIRLKSDGFCGIIDFRTNPHLYRAHEGFLACHRRNDIDHARLLGAVNLADTKIPQ